MQNKYNRTHMQDFRDSVFGLTRQMTINLKITRMENIKKKKKKTNGKHGVFNKFVFVQIGVESTAGAKQEKKCAWCRGCQTVKKRIVF